MLRNYLIAAICVLLFVSCDSEFSSLVEEHNAEGQDFTINVKTFSSQRALNRYLESKRYNSGPEVEGLARWAIKPETQTAPRRCDVFVVKPKSQRDHATQETWGHELMHCVYGSYHEDGVR